MYNYRAVLTFYLRSKKPFFKSQRFYFIKLNKHNISAFNQIFLKILHIDIHWTTFQNFSQGQYQNAPIALWKYQYSKKLWQRSLTIYNLKLGQCDGCCGWRQKHQWCAELPKPYWWPRVPSRCSGRPHPDWKLLSKHLGWVGYLRIGRLGPSSGFWLKSIGPLTLDLVLLIWMELEFVRY